MRGAMDGKERSAIIAGTSKILVSIQEARLISSAGGVQRGLGVKPPLGAVATATKLLKQ